MAFLFFLPKKWKNMKEIVMEPLVKGILFQCSLKFILVGGMARAVQALI